VSAPIKLNPMDTLPTHDADGTPCAYFRANIHKGCILILEGTNGKDAAWVDAHEAFGHRIYRHHILEV
jgi:hypothetical protein